MSNRRAIRFMLIAALLIAGIHVFVSVRGVGNALVNRTVLVDVSAQKATRVLVERQGERATELVLANGWRIVSPYASRAEDTAVKRLVDELTISPVRNSYTESDLLRFGRTRGDYGLESPAVRVTVGEGADAPSVDFGIVTPAGDGVFAAVKGDPRVYVVPVDVFAAADKPSGEFRQKELFPGGLKSVDAFDLKRGAGSFMRFRLRDGLWTRLGATAEDVAEPVSGLKVRTFIAGLARASISDYVWPSGAPDEPTAVTASLLAGYGLDSESAITVTLRSPGMEDLQISFGKEATDGRVYALAQNAGAVVTVDGALKDVAAGSDFSDMRLFPYEPGSVTRLSVSCGGVDYLLARGSDGVWRLDAPVAAPADQATAEALLARVLSLTSADRAAEGVVVTLSTNTPPETVSARAVTGAIALPDLRSREIMKMKPSDVRRISVLTAGSEKPTAVVYDKDLRRWTLESSPRPGTVDSASVDAFLSAVCPLTADKIVKLKASADDLHTYELDKPTWTVALDAVQSGVLRRNVLIGGRAQGGRFATIGSSDAVFVLSDETVQALVSPIVKE